MIEETEIQLENGDKAFVKVRFNDLYKKLIIERVGLLPKRKRSITYFDFTNDYDYRALQTFEEREQYKLNKFLEILTLEQLEFALTNTWNSLKPELTIKN